MRSWILSTFLLLSLVRAIGQKPAESPTPQPAPAQVADDGCANITTVIQAEPGDTFISLFGNNWEAVAACNRFTAVRDGQMMTSPDLLVAGSWIRIPSGTPLTQPAAGRRAGRRQPRTGRALPCTAERQYPLCARRAVCFSRAYISRGIGCSPGTGDTK